MQYGEELAYAWRAASQKDILKRIETQPREPLDPCVLERLDSMILHTASDVMLSEEGAVEKFSAVAELERHLRTFDELTSIVLRPYGSVVNGFATRDSDIDICVTMADSSKVVDVKSTLKRIGVCCSKSISVCNVQYILAARVPLLKLRWSLAGKSKEIHMDITFASAGIRNSKLLAAYCALDKRVRPLGLFVKSWATARKIIGALDSNLSAYAFLLMLVVHLQRVQPPVLPVLQFTRLIENKSCLFFADGRIKDEHGLDVLVREYSSQNTESLSQLFASFMRLLGTELRGGGHCVCPRVGCVIRKPQGNRRSSYKFRLNDPFESRDLASTLDKRGYELLQFEAHDAWNLIAQGRVDALLDVYTHVKLEVEAERVHHHETATSTSVKVVPSPALLPHEPTEAITHLEILEMNMVTSHAVRGAAETKNDDEPRSHTLFDDQEIGIFTIYGPSYIKMTYSSVREQQELFKLKQLFSEYGNVIMIKKVVDGASQCLIKMENKAQELRAVKALSGTKYNGQKCAMVLESANCI